MTVLRVLCFFRWHPRRKYEFVGSSWTPDHMVRALYIPVCVECGRGLATRKKDDL